MRPSLSGIGISLFFLFLGRSIWNFYSTWKSPHCTSDDLQCLHSALNSNPKLTLLVYLSDQPKNLTKAELVLEAVDFDYRHSFEKEIEFDVPAKLRQNGTLYIYSIFLPNQDKQYYKTNSVYLPQLMRVRDATVLKSKLSKYSVPKGARFNLLESESVTKQEDNSIAVRPIAHLRSKYFVLMCTEELHIPSKNVPAEIAYRMRINPKREILPIITQDFLNMRLKDLEPVSNAESMKFKYIYNPTSLGKIRFLLQMEATLHEFFKLGFTEKDVDEVKGVFGDMNLFLLCATMCIGSIHLLLDFLSFKNDVSFWRTHKSMAGLSSRTVLWRTFSQIVIFLYLLDEGTSLLVLIPAGIATLIEIWKVTKVCKTKLSISWTGMNFKSDVIESVAETQTRQYDDECMRYLSYLLYPLCVGSAIYSLIYQPHKSWYSWTINSLVTGVYAFGFLFMFPQLFINYRMKSVAALPWRAFTYKAFNTFIDDIFAFIITMPTAHRVACFRDDIVFLIYLYQRWLYPVDASRVDDGTADISAPVENNEDRQKKED